MDFGDCWPVTEVRTLQSGFKVSRLKIQSFLIRKNNPNNPKVCLVECFLLSFQPHRMAFLSSVVPLMDLKMSAADMSSTAPFLIIRLLGMLS